MFRKVVKALKKKSPGDEYASQDDILYGCGDLQIHLPQQHKLPSYQRHHQKYDKFLPHLAKFIGGDATIIDVGANCGYILAAMAQQNSSAQYICIEPDSLFNSYLRSNLEIIRSIYPDIRVVILDDLVGKNIKNAALQNTGGTSVAVPGEGQIMTRALDDIMREFAGADVRLLKSDTDGFDYDVLDSARGLIEDQHPAIYFECQYDHEYQKAGYETTISWLAAQGYVRWSVFDNFGELMMVTERLEPVFSLMEYIMKQNQKRTTRTIYYLDIMCVCNKDVELMTAALEAY